MPAIESPLEIEQGATFAKGWSVSYNGDKIDDTWTARGQIRPHLGSPVVLYELDLTVNPDGSVVFSIDDDTSSAWTWHAGVYDIKAVNSDESVTVRVAKGPVTVSPQVTP